MPAQEVNRELATASVDPEVPIGVDTQDREAIGLQILGDGSGVIVDTAAADARQDDEVCTVWERRQGDAIASTVLVHRPDLDAFLDWAKPIRGQRSRLGKSRSLCLAESDRGVRSR